MSARTSSSCWPSPLGCRRPNHGARGTGRDADPSQALDTIQADGEAPFRQDARQARAQLAGSHELAIAALGQRRDRNLGQVIGQRRVRVGDHQHDQALARHRRRRGRGQQQGRGDARARLQRAHRPTPELSIAQPPTRHWASRSHGAPSSPAKRHTPSSGRQKWPWMSGLPLQSLSDAQGVVHTRRRGSASRSSGPTARHCSPDRQSASLAHGRPKPLGTQPPSPPATHMCGMPPRPGSCRQPAREPALAVTHVGIHRAQRRADEAGGATGLVGAVRPGERLTQDASRARPGNAFGANERRCRAAEHAAVLVRSTGKRDHAHVEARSRVDTGSRHAILI